MTDSTWTIEEIVRSLHRIASTQEDTNRRIEDLTKSIEGKYLSKDVWQAEKKLLEDRIPTRAPASTWLSLGISLVLGLIVFIEKVA